jgi:hypothetical protein
MNQSKSPFKFFEIVLLNKTQDTRIFGLEGVVLGMAQGEDGQWSYAVHIYQNRTTYSCMADEMEATGRFDKYENFYDGSSIHVKVDPKTGEGSIEE